MPHKINFWNKKLVMTCIPFSALRNNPSSVISFFSNGTKWELSFRLAVNEWGKVKPLKLLSGITDTATCYYLIKALCCTVTLSLAHCQFSDYLWDWLQFKWVDMDRIKRYQKWLMWNSWHKQKLKDIQYLALLMETCWVTDMTLLRICSPVR